MQQRGVKMTSRFGTFYFYSSVILSHAKLIRDTITGQAFFPAMGTRRITSAQEAYDFIAGLNSSKVIRDTPFSVVLKEKA